MTQARQLLAVDDNPFDREILTQALGVAFPEARVQSLDDPSKVESLCLDQRFDCILLDQNMPQMDGLTLARRLRAAYTHMPIVLVTNLGDDMLAAEAMRSGVSDYLAKSRISTESVRRVVDRAVHSAAQQRLIDQQHDELETFAYALAHDFKQPIRQIITFSRMILDELDASASVEMRKHLGFLGHAAGRLDKLVDVMVQYTLLTQKPQLTDVPINSVINSVRSSLTPLLVELGGELFCDVKATVVRGNEALMTQVLQNLVVNGLRYNKSPSPRVEISVRADGEHCLIEVRDNGIGIAPQYIGEIFKPLIRLHSHKEYPGSGLGLTLARKAIIAQEGEIWCESTPDKGSAFHVRLRAGAKRRKGRVI